MAANIGNFLAPALKKMMGRSEVISPIFSAILAKDYHSQAGKVRLERVMISYKNGQYFARPVRSLGSGDMFSMTQANGLMMVGRSVARLPAGAEVRIQLF